MLLDSQLTVDILDVVPVCQRCIKRKRGDQCVYVANPLAKVRIDQPTSRFPTNRHSELDSSITEDKTPNTIIQSCRRGLNGHHCVG